MRNRNRIVSALALLALAGTSPHTRAQSIYSTPYTFTTLAGNAGYGSADGTGSAARFSGPYGVAVDTNVNVYVADTYNNTIRKVTPAGVVTTFAGLAGGSGTNDGTGSDARFSFPIGVAVDTNGNIYVADASSHTIRQVTPAGAVTTLAGLPGVSGTNNGTGSAARFNFPSGVAVDTSGNVYVADSGNYTIRKVTPAGVVTTLAGQAGSFGSADGTGSAARFGGESYGDGPSGVAVDSAGNVYVADTHNCTIRQVTSTGEVTTLAGLAYHPGSADGTGSAARFSQLDGVAVDASGNVYVADTVNGTIRQMTQVGTDWVVTTLAGGASPCCISADGTGTSAHFYFPFGVAVDSAGNVYVADTYNNEIRRMTPAAEVTTLAGLAGSRGSQDGTGSAAGFFWPNGVAVETNGNIYVADTSSHTIRKVTPAGVVTTLAGMFDSFGTNDGTGSAARFNYPNGVTVDNAGNVYVADSGNYTIRQVTPAGVVTTLAGMGGSSGTNDGMGSDARFDAPFGVAVDTNGNVYVAEGIGTIRKVTPVGPNWVVTTLAGSAYTIGSADGTGSAARFNNPLGVAVDSAGNLYVVDSVNYTIRKGTPALQFDPSAGSLTVSNGLFRMRLIGPSGSNVVVEASADLAAWTPVQTNALPQGGLHLSVPVSTDQKRFFRARLAP